MGSSVPQLSVVSPLARQPNHLDIFVVGEDGGIYSSWWDKGDARQRWNLWFRIGPDWANVPSGSQVTAISRKPDQIDLFVVGHDGGIYSTWWNPNDGWEGNHNWFRIGPEWANVPQRSVVTAIARTPDQIDLFVVGHDGGIYSTWWNPNDGWDRNHNWFRIGPNWANVPQLSVVSAISRNPNQIDLFVVGHNGGIYSTWWNPNDGWEGNHNWFRIGPEWANVPQNSVVAAITRSPQQIDLFVVGHNGGVYSTWWNPNDGWEGNHNWFRIGPEWANFPTNSVVTAIARNPVALSDTVIISSNIDLFLVGHDGGIYSTWWNPNDGWEGNHNWFRIGPEWANVPQRSVVTAVSRQADQIDLFVVGHNGGIYSTWWNPNDGWERNHNWFRITSEDCIRIHVKLLTPTTNNEINLMLTSMRQIFEPAGFRVEIISTETLNLPLLSILSIGNCLRGETTEEQDQLFANRNNAGPSDIVIYFVASTIPPFGGCASHPDNQPGAVVVQGNGQWTMAHEIGHVLGLDHPDNSSPPLLDRLMTRVALNQVTNLPPDLTADEITTMRESDYSDSC